MQIIRKSFLFIIFFAGIFLISVKEVRAESHFPYTENFLISGYYSPLPDQSVYITGSYEGDVRLNGEGVHSADGTIVFPGMIAASPEIPFNTKMFIPGIGMTEVHDRGGAIKNKRLDIWMGHGEVGLRRALHWGFREVPVTVYGKDSTKTVQVDLENLPLAPKVWLYVQTVYFRHDLTLGDKSDAVSEMQQMLKKLGYFENEITGFYGEETKQAVLRFQLDNNIIANHENSGAGHFGPRTRSTLEDVLREKRKNPPSDEEIIALLGFQNVFSFQRTHGIALRKDEYGAGVIGPRTEEKLQSEYRKYLTPSAEKLDIPKRHLEEESIEIFREGLKFGDRGDDVTRLQRELKRYNFFRLEPTGYYGKVTEHAVFKFQQAMGIVKTKDDSGAGYAGPQTRLLFHELVAEREEKNRAIAKKTDQKEKIAFVRQKERGIVSEKNLRLASLLQTDLLYGDIHEEVGSLQTVLKELGYFKGRIITDYFGDITRDSLMQFQINHGIIDSEKDSGAGRFNAETKNALQKLLRG